MKKYTIGKKYGLPFGALGLLLMLASDVFGQSSSLVVTGFFTEYGVETRDYVPADVPADYLTHLNYAFSVPRDTDEDGMFECAWGSDRLALEEPIDRLIEGTHLASGEYRGVLRQLGVLKRSHPKLKMVLSVGGSCTYDEEQGRCIEIAPRFKEITTSEEHTRHFVESCVAMIADPIPGEPLSETLFDGIDLDWEFPDETDTEAFTSLVLAFRERLDEAETDLDRTFELSIDGAASRFYIKNIRIQDVASLVDRVNIMSYGFYMPQSWSPVTGPHAPAGSPDSSHFGVGYNIFQTSVSSWMEGGMPSGKIVLGLPLYGVGYQGVQIQNARGSEHSSFMPYEGPLHTEYGIDGTIPFYQIEADFGTDEGYIEGWDDMGEVPYRFNKGERVWISYDNQRSLIRKILQARRMKLGGVFMWELALEARSGMRNYPLSRVVAEAAGHTRTGKVKDIVSPIHVSRVPSNLSVGTRIYDVTTLMDTQIDVEIIDANETTIRLVYQGPITEASPIRFEIGLDDLSPGPYLMRVRAENQTELRLMMVE